MAGVAIYQVTALPGVEKLPPILAVESTQLVSAKESLVSKGWPTLGKRVAYVLFAMYRQGSCKSGEPFFFFLLFIVPSKPDDNALPI